MELVFKLLSRSTWSDFEQLFGEKGACGGCWCQWWKVKRSEWEKRKGARNKLAMETSIRSGKVPGILVYDDRMPIGWCAIEPREHYPVIERSRSLKRINDQAVWSITCFFIAKTYRNQGLSVLLINEAVRYARSQGATVVEGYPAIPKKGAMPPAFAWTGLEAAFRKSGFEEVARPSKSRVIMRFQIDG